MSGVAIVGLTIAAAGQERDRSHIPEKYRWNLADIFTSDAAWRASKDGVATELPELRQFQGRLSSSASTLAQALEKLSDLNKRLARVYAYATLLADQDTRDSAHEGMRQEVTQLASTLASAAAYIEPEILRMPMATIEKFVASEPRLRVYRLYLDDIERRAPHTLGESEEKLLADVGPLAQAPAQSYSILTNADFAYPTVTLGDGRSVKINQAAYADLRALPNREDRERVMSAFFKGLGGYGRTFGATMNGEVQKMSFLMKARKYGSALETSLDGPNIPVSVYQRLLQGVDRNLPVFHRYLRLRQRLLQLDQLHYYDLYAPLVGSVKLQYTPDEAEQLVLAAVAPLGPEYAAVLRRAFSDRWIDLLPSEGKRSGAYSEDAGYDIHPYMLINFNGKYTDVSTLAHELGHTMQTYLSNQKQPYPLASYPIFVAEVASTFNEALLIEHMLKNVTDKSTRLSLLGDYLENIKGTVFRQTQFAEFELRMHEMAQKGQPITGAALASLYLEITRKYYGHDQGVCIVDDYVAHEWSYIPHFYRDFYVFQYATSFTASAALAQKVLAGDAAAKARYLEFVSAGGSKYPIDLLKDAGVDMTTDEPLDLTIKTMTRVMDEIEALIK